MSETINTTNRGFLMFDLGKDRIEGFVEKNIEYDIESGVYNTKIDIYSPYVFSKEEIEEISRLSTFKENVVLKKSVTSAVVNGNNMSKIEISLKPLASKDRVDDFCRLLVIQHSSFIWHCIQQMQSRKQLEEER